MLFVVVAGVVNAQEESRSSRCMIVCADPETPNTLMVDNIEQFQVRVPVQSGLKVQNMHSDTQ